MLSLRHTAASPEIKASVSGKQDLEGDLGLEYMFVWYLSQKRNTDDSFARLSMYVSKQTQKQPKAPSSKSFERCSCRPARITRDVTSMHAKW